MRDDIENNNEKAVYVKKSKFGRPPKNDHEQRRNAIKLSCTDEELALFKQWAGERGYVQLSRFVRDFLLEIMACGKFEAKIVPSINIEAHNQISGLCNNVNQMAKILNSQPENCQPHMEVVKQLIIDLTDVCKDVVASLNGYSSTNVKRSDGQVDSLAESYVSMIKESPLLINVPLVVQIKKLIESLDKKSKMEVSGEGKEGEQFRAEMKILSWYLQSTALLLLGQRDLGLLRLKVAIGLQKELKNGNP